MDIRDLFFRRYAIGGPVRSGQPMSVASPTPGINYSDPLGLQGLKGPFPQQPAPAPAAPTENGIAASQKVSALDPENTFQAQVPTSNQQFNPGQFQGTVAGSQDTLNGLAQALRQQAAGGGPNLADAQERQATDRNIAQQFALAQSGNGGPAALRAAMNNTSAMNQQAAADSATQRMQQQLAAQQQLQSLGLGQLGTAGSLLTDQQKMGLEQSQGNQNAALTAQGQNLQATLANQGVASGLTNTGLSAAGGLLNGGAAALAHLPAPNGTSAQTTGDVPTAESGSGMDSGGSDPFGAGTLNQPTVDGLSPSPYAHGGLVRAIRAYASGGAVPNDYTMRSQVADPRAPNLLGAAGVVPSFAAAIAPRVAAAAPQAGNQLTNTGEQIVGALPFGLPVVLAQKAMDAAHSAIDGPNPYAQTPDHQDKLFGGTNPNALGRAMDNGIYDVGQWVGNLFHAQGGLINALRAGGVVPGKAKVAGNSYANDTVPAMLSPGEVVLPRSVSQAEDAPDKAKAFVEAIKKSKGGEVTSYEQLLAKQRELRAQVAALDAKLKKVNR